MEAKWSESIREAAAPQYGRILRHPFICGLADGSLPAECFARYLAQDELYLPAYGSMLHRLADMLPEEEDTPATAKASQYSFTRGAGYYRRDK